MNVQISQAAIDDLKNIFTALITWEKGALELEHALQYIDDIENQCYSIGYKSYHSKTTFSTHKLFGDKVYKYRRNSTTTWYIIYKIDNLRNIIITKIISNYKTIKP
jgi:plasmid stabilization system protein ParE